jgi:hypothetical protein
MPAPSNSVEVVAPGELERSDQLPDGEDVELRDDSRRASEAGEKDMVVATVVDGTTIFAWQGIITIGRAMCKSHVLLSD